MSLAAFAGVGVLAARAQSTARPGEPTQSHVWVENRAPADAVPVVVQGSAAPLTVHVDSSSTVQTIAGRQTWEYRSIPLAAGAEPARALSTVGSEGWEAVGVLQSGAAGATVLLKRPR
jgi:hypothetical protein